MHRLLPDQKIAVARQAQQWEGVEGNAEQRGARCSPVGQGVHGWHEDGFGHLDVGLQRSTQCRRTSQKAT